jgi:hypothetical protein
LQVKFAPYYRLGLLDMLDLPVTYLCFEQGYISLAELVTPSNSKRNATPLSTLNYEIARADLVKKTTLQESLVLAPQSRG